MKIISGGEEGVERAVLDVAAKNNLEWGGWFSKGNLINTEKTLNLQEVSTTLKQEKIIKNATESDVTIIIVDGFVFSPGVVDVVQACTDLGKYYFLIDLKNKVAIKQMETLLSRLTREKDDIIINFVGPSEKESPGIYDKAFNIINKSIKLK